MGPLSLASTLRWRPSLGRLGGSAAAVNSSSCLASTTGQHLRWSHQRSLPSKSEELLAFDRQLDVHPKRQSVSSGSNSVHIINDPPVYRPPPNNPQAFAPPSTAFQETTTVLSGNDAAAQATDLSLGEIMKLHRYALVMKRVSQMTPKGKIPTMFAMVVVGNGNGIVGLGQGKHALAARAIDKAFVQAVRDLSAVDRFEDRTIWGSRKDHWGATEIEMWSRPPGFGLRTSHIVHQIAKAAGLSDLSAKVRGSKNPMQTAKLAIRMLQSRSYPLGMGNGFGKGASRKVKGVGMRNANEIALERGRRAVEV